MGSDPVCAGIFPVAPGGDVLQTVALVVLAILQILCAHQTLAATGIDQVLEVDNARGPVLLTRPGCGDRPAGVRQLGISENLLGDIQRLEF